MKHTIVASAAIALFLVLFASTNASGTDVEIGVSGGYNSWNPAWNNGKIVIYPPDMIKWVDRFAPRYSTIGYFSYGPDLSVQFLRHWEFSTSFRYGEMSTSGSGPALIPDLLFRNLGFTIKNYDVYGNFSIRFFNWMKVFAGMRAEIIDFTVEYTHLEITAAGDLFRTTMEGRSLHFTPELGLGAAVQITPVFGIHASVAGTFQSGSSKAEYKDSFHLKGLELGMQRIPAARYYATGISTHLALCFTIPRIDTTISISGYYRLLRYMQKTSRQGIHALDGSLDHLTGFFTTVSYRFSFDENKSREVWIPRPRYD